MGKTATTKKQVLSDFIQKLEAVLSDLKNELGEKKFNKRLKKAAKLLLQGLEKPKQPVKKAAAKKAPAKAIANKKTATKTTRKAVKKTAPAKNADVKES